MPKKSKRRWEDFVNKKIGKLTILSGTRRDHGKKKNTVILTCRCDCGNVIECPSSYLFASHPKKSCGCAYKDAGKRRRSSNNWKIDIDELREVVAKSTLFCDILRHFNVFKKDLNNIGRLKKICDENQIDYSHIGSTNKGKKFLHIRKSYEERLKSIVRSSALKKLLFEFNLIENKCAECNNTGEWNGKKLVLQLHHINGINNDNRIENLQLLCPNCHSQTDTYCKQMSKRENQPKVIAVNKRNKHGGITYKPEQL